MLESCESSFRAAMAVGVRDAVHRRNPGQDVAGLCVRICDVFSRLLDGRRDPHVSKLHAETFGLRVMEFVALRGDPIDRLGAAIDRLGAAVGNVLDGLRIKITPGA